MAALPDWRETLVVSHWGFILAMTGERVDNGQWLRCDPTEPAPDRHRLAGAARFHRRQALTAAATVPGAGAGARARSRRRVAPAACRRPGADQHATTKGFAMSDQSSPPPPPGLQAAPGAAPGVGPLVLNIQYTKDLSFEVPGAPEIFATLREPPRVDIQLDVQARAAPGGRRRVRGDAPGARRRQGAASTTPSRPASSPS